MAMSQEHKDALARGRREARSIKRYLNALSTKKPGRPVTRETLEKRLVSLDARIAAEENPLKAVELVQTRLEVENQLSALDDEPSIDELEAEFVESVDAYSKRKDISYTAWREVGVPAAVLRAAGVKETRRR